MIGRRTTQSRDSQDIPALVTRIAGRRAVVILHVVALIVVAVEFIQPLDHGGYGVERVSALDFSASYALYGFTACVALVLLGRWLRRAVMRDESYYDGAD